MFHLSNQDFTHHFIFMKPWLLPGRNASLLLTVFVLTSAVVLAQSGRTRSTAAEQTQDPDEVIRIRTDEVLLPVSVRDSKGNPVSGLGLDSFAVFDTGVRQDIASFNRQRVKANIVLLLDASGSVFNQMRVIRDAAKRFANGLMPEDSVCVMQFADKVEVLQDWISASEIQTIDKALDWRYRPGESTAFYEGLNMAATRQLRKVEGRKIIILLTDGIDTSKGSPSGFERALSSVKQAEASVYVVSLTAMLREEIKKMTGGNILTRLISGYDPRLVAHYLAIIDQAEENLAQLAEKTGGRIFLPRKEDDLAPAYAAIAEELRTQYILTYRPKPPAPPGQWREIKVVVLPGAYEVAARPGYFGKQ